MRQFVLAVGLTLVGCAGLVLVYECWLGPKVQIPPIAEPPTAKGTLPIPEDQIKGPLSDAKKEVERRFQLASSYRWWARAASWMAFVLTALMTVLVGFYGGGVPPSDNVPATLNHILKGPQTSKSLTRLLGAI